MGKGTAVAERKSVGGDGAPLWCSAVAGRPDAVAGPPPFPLAATP